MSIKFTLTLITSTFLMLVSTAVADSQGTVKKMTIRASTPSKPAVAELTVSGVSVEGVKTITGKAGKSFKVLRSEGETLFIAANSDGFGPFINPGDTIVRTGDSLKASSNYSK